MSRIEELRAEEEAYVRVIRSLKGIRDDERPAYNDYREGMRMAVDVIQRAFLDTVRKQIGVHNSETV